MITAVPHHIFTDLAKAWLSPSTRYSPKPQNYNLLSSIINDRLPEPTPNSQFNWIVSFSRLNFNSSWIFNPHSKPLQTQSILTLMSLKSILDSITRLTTIVTVTVPICLALQDTHLHEAMALTCPCPVGLVLKALEVAHTSFHCSLTLEPLQWLHQVFWSPRVLFLHRSSSHTYQLLRMNWRHWAKYSLNLSSHPLLHDPSLNHHPYSLLTLDWLQPLIGPSTTLLALTWPQWSYQGAFLSI